MRKLLSANLSRLWKDKLYWGLMAFMAIGSVIFGWMTFRTATGSEESYYVEDILFNLLPMIGFAVAFFVSLRVGTEFDNHTIRNKMIVGHSRLAVFFSEYGVCLLASLSFLVVMLLFSGISGYILFRKFALGWQMICQMFFCCVLLTGAFSAIFVGISMNVHSKATAVVANVVFLLAIYFMASFVGSALNESEMTYEYVRITAEGGLEFGDMVKNPAYVEGVQRSIYQFIYDAFPTGQAIQLNNLELEQISRWPALSVIMLTIFTASGYLGFCKRDIK